MDRVTLPSDNPPEPTRRRGRWIAAALGVGALVLVGVTLSYS